MDIVNSILENNAQEKDNRKSTIVNKDVEVETDVGTLLALDYSNVDLKVMR